jgi:two-component system phosphate regulon sensor histidine kinase PhoR
MGYFCFMNKWVTTLIILLVTFATIGLLIIQVYWIKDAVKVKQAVFLRDVEQAMTNVVFEIDKMRLHDRVIKQQKFFQQNQSFYKVYDSLNRLLTNVAGNITSQSELDNFVFNSNLARNALSHLNYNYPEQEAGIFLFSKKDQIDSLISNELRDHRIRTEYEFGIYNPATNSMILQKTGKYPEELVRESYVFNLSPLGSLYSFPNKLLIFFPNERSFVVQQLWELFTVSVFLFLVIIVSFSFSIYIINRQKRLSVMKNDFVNNMTHEFKTPISTIALACEALKDKDVQKSDIIYNNYVSVISEENHRLSSMAEQILQTAVIEKGQLRLKIVLIDIHDIIQDAVKRKQISAQEKGGNIELQLKATNFFVQGDKIHLTNVIINLIDNALKYNLNQPFLVINTVNNDNSLLIRVKDNGIGISKSNQKKVFEKLYRVPTGNVHDFKGFGLGLSYVKATIELHNGNVSVDSEPGKGSIFTIKLPTKKD